MSWLPGFTVTLSGDVVMSAYFRGVSRGMIPSRPTLIPMLAASSAVALAAALLGGSLTAATHFSKAGARAAANTSPEPFSNLALSFTEDAAVVAGSWLAVQHPEVFLVLLAIFLVLIAVLMSWLIRGFRRLFRPAELR